MGWGKFLTSYGWTAAEVGLNNELELIMSKEWGRPDTVDPRRKTGEIEPVPVPEFSNRVCNLGFVILGLKFRM